MRDIIAGTIGAIAYVTHQILQDRRARKIADALDRLSEAIRRGS